MTPQIPDLLPVRIIPEIAASSPVRGSTAASPQSQGSIAKVLHRFLNTKKPRKNDMDRSHPTPDTLDGTLPYQGAIMG